VTVAARTLPRGALLSLPSQARSAARVHAILDAAMAVLLEGERGFTTKAVAAAAGVPVGSVYQYFANKEMLVAGILERGVLSSDAVVRATYEANSGGAPRAMIRGTLLALIALLAPHRALIAALYESAPRVTHATISSVMGARLMDISRDFFLLRVDRYRLVDGPASLYVAVNAAIPVFLKWLIEQPPGVPRAAFVEALARSMAAGIEEIPAD
jgi:AcrR family transcriptional regulator